MYRQKFRAVDIADIHPYQNQIQQEKRKHPDSVEAFQAQSFLSEPCTEHEEADALQIGQAHIGLGVEEPQIEAQQKGGQGKPVQNPSQKSGKQVQDQQIPQKPGGIQEGQKSRRQAKEGVEPLDPAPLAYLVLRV